MIAELKIKYNRSNRQYQVMNGKVISEHPTKLDARIKTIAILDSDLHSRLAERIEAETEAAYHNVTDAEGAIKREVSAAEIILSGKLLAQQDGELFAGKLVLVATVDSNGDGENIRQVYAVINEDRIICTCEDYEFGHAPANRCKHIRAYEIVTARQTELFADVHIDF